MNKAEDLLFRMPLKARHRYVASAHWRDWCPICGDPQFSERHRLSPDPGPVIPLWIAFLVGSAIALITQGMPWLTIVATAAVVIFVQLFDNWVRKPWVDDDLPKGGH